MHNPSGCDPGGIFDGSCLSSSPVCHCEEGKARRGNPSFLGRFRAVSVRTVSDGPFLSIAKERGKERQQKLRFCISFRAMSSPLRYLIPRVRGEFPDYVSPSNAFIISAAAADAIDDRNKFVLLISTDCHVAALLAMTDEESLHRRRWPVH